MKVLRLKGVGQVELTDEPVPVVAPGESLVRVSAVGLCGSDLHWYAEGSIGDARLNEPLVLGHEFGGVVEGGPLDGQAVAVAPAVPCGLCDRCREGNHNLCPFLRFAGHGKTDGGLREYVPWPTNLLYPVPAPFTPATVALLEPLGVALHAFDLGHVRFGSSIAVLGCGPIGLMLVQVGKAAGVASVVAVEPLAHRRQAGLECGADIVLSPDGAREYPAEVDVVFEVSGADEAVATAVRLVRPGGQVVLVGIPDDDKTTFPASLARRKGLTLRLVRRMKDTYPRAIDLVQRKAVDLDRLVSQSFKLEEGAQAFAAACRRQGLKTIVEVG